MKKILAFITMLFVLTGPLYGMELIEAPKQRIGQSLLSKEHLMTEIDNMTNNTSQDDEWQAYLQISNTAIANLRSSDLIEVLDKIEQKLPFKLIHLAARFNDSGLLLYLRKNGVDINLKDSYGKTAFHWAAEFNAVNVLKLLFDWGANTSLTDVKGRSPLFYAAHDNALEAMELFKNYKVINLHDYDKTPILHYAAEHNAVELIKLLVKKWGIDVNSKGPGTSDYNAFNYIVSDKCLDSMKILKELGSNFELDLIKGAVVNDKDVSGLLALLVAWGDLDVNKALKFSPDSQATLLEAGHVFNKKQNMDMLYFLGAKITDRIKAMLADKKNSARLAPFKLLYQIETELNNDNAFELLCNAANQGFSCSVKKILDQKIVDANQKIDKKGFTILHEIASTEDALKLFKVFLRCPEIEPYARTYGTKEHCLVCGSQTPKDKLLNAPLKPAKGCKECGALTPYDLASKEVKALYDEMRYRIFVVLVLRNQKNSDLPEELVQAIFKFVPAKYAWQLKCLMAKPTEAKNERQHDRVQEKK